jgi:HlyD family secretion protein
MALSRKKKVGIGLFLLLIIVGGGITARVMSNNKTVTEVQVAEVKRRELIESKVTASGDVRPVKFYNLTAEVGGRVTDIYVREGDVVKAEQPLLRVDPTQQINATASQEAVLRAQQQDAYSAEIQWRAAENSVNNVRTSIIAAEADVKRAEADLSLAESEYSRALEMTEAGIFPKSQFDTAKNRRDTSRANLESQKARLQQLAFQLKNAEADVKRNEAFFRGAEERVNSSRANLLNAQDILNKTIKKSPINGVVSSLPVKEGEFVLANLNSSALMLIADMSNVNVEVKVDETDIGNVKIGQPAKVKIDALGESEIVGEVIEIGHSAVTRSGQTIVQNSNSQEAKDFKVVIKLKAEEEMLNRLRPGMSATATITTDARTNILAIPLQALVVKDAEDLSGNKPATGGANTPNEANNAATTTNSNEDQDKNKKRAEVEGVFIFRGDKVDFIPVKTGLTGESEIEIKEGLSDNDKIVVGPFRELRTLKSGTAVKVAAEKKPEIKTN